VSERVINVRSISHWESEIRDEGFELKFIAFTDGEKRYHVNLHFDWWALPYLARELWKVVTRRRTKIEGELKAAENALREPE